MSFKEYLDEQLDLPIVSVPPTKDVQKEVETEDEDLDEAKSPEERLAKDMLKILKKHASDRGVQNIKNVVSNMMTKVGGY